jgi:hypothetical protein
MYRAFLIVFFIGLMDLGKRFFYGKSMSEGESNV